MDDNTAASFTDTANGSRRSTINSTASSNVSQVASVGFNNLKKRNSNSSLTSEASSNTLKSNRLSRLFSKPGFAKSSVSRKDSSPEKQIEDDSLDSHESGEQSQSSLKGLLKLSKGRLKFLNSGLAKPKLAVQTKGLQSFKRPQKKLLGLNQKDESPTVQAKKGGKSSPALAFHSLFHKSHSNTLLNKDFQSLNVGDTQSPMNGNNTRTTICLSSNNSNSYISDMNFALLYKFTNPNYQAENPDGIGEHSSFFDLPKKMMLPADHYLQNKTYKGKHEIGLGIAADENFDIQEEKLKDDDFYNSLFGIMKPLFLPSQRRTLSNGQRHTCLGHSVEEIACYVTAYFENAETLPTNISGKVNPKLNKSNNSASFTQQYYEDFRYDDIKFREITIQLSYYLESCLQMYNKDFSECHRSDRKAKLALEDHNVTNLIDEWDTLRSLWFYFNREIRFTVLAIFKPLQMYLKEISFNNYVSESHSIYVMDIETLTLAAFRDVIVYPFLTRRENFYKHFSLQKVPSVTLFKDQGSRRAKLGNEELGNITEEVRKQEENIIKSYDNSLLKELISCFGVIRSITNDEWLSQEKKSSSVEVLFVNTFNWLSNL